jgi:hypothetical protein
VPGEKRRWASKTDWQIMTFTDVVKDMLLSASSPMTPQEIREQIKKNFPQYYRTPSHIRNVTKGHYKDEDHALLSQIYSLVRMNSAFFCDINHKPMMISLKNKKKLRSKYKTVSKQKYMSNESDFITNIEYYYKQSLDVMKDFGGPSIYFHVQAIKEQESAFLSDRHIEMIYATLASWGMHRMGSPDDTKAKMVEFDVFKTSILCQRKRLQKFVSKRLESCTSEQYEEYLDNLKDIYFGLKVSIADATVVAHSKTLAHILPNLVHPIDRQYTIRFFTQDNKDFFTKSGKYRSINLPNGIDAQFRDFIKYSCMMKALFDRCDHKMFTINSETFNTSFPKIIDNLIMAFVKDVSKPIKATRR